MFLRKQVKKHVNCSLVGSLISNSFGKLERKNSCVSHSLCYLTTTYLFSIKLLVSDYFLILSFFYNIFNKLNTLVHNFYSLELSLLLLNMFFLINLLKKSNYFLQHLKSKVIYLIATITRIHLYYFSLFEKSDNLESHFSPT